MRLKVLYVLPYFPFSLRSGSSFRASNVIKRLVLRHDVHILCLGYDHRTDPSLRETEAACSSISVVPYRHSRMRGVIRALISFTPYDLAIHHNPQLARLVMKAQADLNPDIVLYSRLSGAQFIQRCCDAVQIADQHDLMEAFWALASRGSKSPWFRAFASLNRRLSLRKEQRIYCLFDGVISVSDTECMRTREFLPRGIQVLTLPNGADTEYFSPRAESVVDNGTMLLTGAMNAQRNIDAAVEFADRIFPKVRKLCPEARFQVVGHSPAPEVLALATRPGIEVTGEVSDIRPYLTAAELVVAPFWSGSGVKHKVPIAMAMGKACVVTPNAAQGLNLEHEVNTLVAETPDQFAQNVVRLIKDPALRKKIGETARTAVVAHYSWDTLVNQLDNWLCERARENVKRHREARQHRRGSASDSR